MNTLCLLYQELLTLDWLGCKTATKTKQETGKISPKFQKFYSLFSTKTPRVRLKLITVAEEVGSECWPQRVETQRERR